MSTKITTIIIDDEQLARDVITGYLKNYPEVEVVAECSNGFEGLKSIQEHKPDLVFLDVKMPKITGFEMLELLEEAPVIVFSTAYDEYAIHAFEKNAVDYLLKPYAQDRFDGAMEKVKSKLHGNINQKPILDQLRSQPMVVDTLDRVVVKSGSKINILPVGDIIYFEAMDDYVRLHTSEQGFLKQSTMKYFEQNLPEQEFIRVHRSYIVQVEEISKLEPMGKESFVVLLKNGTELPVSRSGYTKLKTVLNF